MTKRILEEACVRVKVIDGNDETLSFGTGVLVNDSNTFYVLTALHTLKVDESIADNDLIVIETQKSYNSPFENIKVVEISEYDDKNDWALIEIDFKGESELINSLKIGSDFLDDDDVVLYGYQAINKEEFNNFSAKVQNVSDDEFKIRLNGSTFDQGGESGKTIASGLSGSGVYVKRGNAFFLIGIVTKLDLYNDVSLNDDICCCPCSNLKKYLSIQSLSDDDFIDKWESSIDANFIDVQIDNFKSEPNDFFENLNRKNNVLYSPDKASEINITNIKDYLGVKEAMNLVNEKNPQFEKKYLRGIRRLERKIEEYISTEVENPKEALQIKAKVYGEVESILSEIQLNKLVKEDIANYQVILWLMNCTLDFEIVNND